MTIFFLIILLNKHSIYNNYGIKCDGEVAEKIRMKTK